MIEANDQVVNVVVAGVGSAGGGIGCGGGVGVIGCDGDMGVNVGGGIGCGGGGVGAGVVLNVDGLGSIGGLPNVDGPPGVGMGIGTDGTE